MQTSGTSGDSASVTRLAQWFARRPYLSLTLLVLLALGPFLAKPLNVDDPLFVWAAKRITMHPADPYGFNVNWYGTSMPMWATTKNPPLACYYLALAGTGLGWSEVALHAAMLLPAIAAVLGTYRLARHFCDHPGLAAVVTLLSPVFLISSSTLMCDTMMLAFWIWATVWWVEGLKKNDVLRLVGSGVLIALAALTKYYGICLVPLLLVHALWDRRKMGAWLWCLAIPVAAMVAFELASWARYGTGLFLEAGYFTQSSRNAGQSRWADAVFGLAFVGGCLAATTFLTPMLWKARTQLVLISMAALMVISLFASGTMTRLYSEPSGSRLLWAGLQMIIWATGGLGIIWLTVVELRRRFDPETWLLCGWALGTIVFTTFCNWTINGRSILPATPAVAILLTRHWNRLAGSKDWRRVVAMGGLALSALLAVLCTWADFRLATAVRQTAQQAAAHRGDQKSELWLDAHWGMQYYLEALGGRSIDWRQSACKENDLVVIALNNPTFVKNPTTLEQDFKNIHLETVLTSRGSSFLTTVQTCLGASYYSSHFGPLPFAFGRVPPEAVYVYRVGSAREQSAETSPP